MYDMAWPPSTLSNTSGEALLDTRRWAIPRTALGFQSSERLQNQKSALEQVQQRQAEQRTRLAAMEKRRAKAEEERAELEKKIAPLSVESLALGRSIASAVREVGAEQ